MTDSLPIIRKRSEHRISRRNIDRDSLKVLYRLSDRGHTAYLVGGGVRDLLLGRKPKDFDISTDAHPGRIKKLFRNCFLIGRRFRLAHIKFGDHIVETSTFRRVPELDADPEDPEADLFHRRDNTFGTPETDAVRRDFTINGLFYDIKTFDVIDYVGGLKDLEKGVIRCIGDPDIRFREDPVRMIRAVRFASRLGFKIGPKTHAAILKHHQELEKAAPPRLLEEIYRLFGFQSGEAACRLLKDTRLMSVLFPELDVYVSEADDGARLWRYLAALDGLASDDDAPNPCLLFGSLYYPLVRTCVDELRESGEHFAYADLVKELLTPLGQRYPVPRRIFTRLLRVLTAQQRFEPARRRRFSMRRFLSQDGFDDALELFRIHLTATDGDLGRLEPWRQRYREYLKEAGPERAGDRHGERGAQGSSSRRGRRPSGRGRTRRRRTQ